MAMSSSLITSAEAALAQGRLAEAARLARLAVEENPGGVEENCFLGLIQAQRGALDEAEDHFRRALEADNQHLPSLIACSKVLSTRGQVEAALAMANAALEIAPEDFDAAMHFGLLLAHHRRFAEAAGAFSEALKISPKSSTAQRFYAGALSDAGLKSAALEAWRSAAQLAPRDGQVWARYGQTALEQGLLNEAISAGRKAASLAPENPSIQLMVGLALAEGQEPEAAEVHIRRSIKLNPNNPIAHAALGYWLQEQGRFADAEVELEAALKGQPDHGFAYYNLFRSRRATAEDKARLKSIEARAGRKDLTPRDRGYMNYALGKAREDLKDFEAAMGHYDEGNRCAYEAWLAASPWRRDEYAADFARKREVFTRERLQELSAQGRPSKRPVFIVGMIRSGTSLMEQIVSSHPEVAGAGELSFWHENEESCWGPDDLPCPERLKEASGRYAEELQRLAPNARRVTDKLPHNFALLGEIHSALPEARFVHCRRNPADNCLSVYTTAYQRPPVFAHDRENIAFAYREYLRMMEHWREVLPADRLLEVDYEEMVADRESVVRRVIEFIGLDWDDACLRHESNQRAVRTPSLWQVRQPIYTTSIERWRRFEPWIPEFAALVESP